MKKFNFAIDKSTIGSWVKDAGQDLLMKEVLGADTIKVVEIQPGIKYKEQLKYLDTDALLQVYACAWTASGTTTLTKKDIQVQHFKIEEALCPSDLNDTALMLSQSPGTDKDLPFEAQYLSLKVQGAQKHIENKTWVQATGSTYKVAGLLNQFADDSDVVDYTFDFTNTGLTDANLIIAVNAMVDLVPEEITSREDLTLFCGKDFFRKLSRAYLNTGNVLLSKFTFNGVDMFELPGNENIKVYAVNGLNKANNTDVQLVITPASNIIIGMDMVSEEEKTEMWWSQDNNQLRFHSSFKFGPAYKIGAYVVCSKKS